MLTFEVINELTLKVTCEGKDTLITKMGAFIAGENDGAKNYSFEKMLLGPGGSIGQAVFGQLVRKVAGENIPLMKVNLHGNSTTYYACYGQHVVVYKLAIGETVSVESPSSSVNSARGASVALKTFFCEPFFVSSTIH